MLQDTGTLPQSGMTRAVGPPLPPTIHSHINMQSPYDNDIAPEQPHIN